MTLCERSAIWYCILGTSPACATSASFRNIVCRRAHVYPSNEANEDRVEACDERSNSLAKRLPLSRNWLSSVISSKAETLTFAKADMIPTRML
nr:hypothetical protein CFP56_57875 [Quercus suber]